MYQQKHYIDGIGMHGHPQVKVMRRSNFLCQQGETLNTSFIINFFLSILRIPKCNPQVESNFFL